MTTEEDNSTKEKTINHLPIHCLRAIIEPLNLRDRIRASAVSTVFREIVQFSECRGDDTLLFGNCGELNLRHAPERIRLSYYLSVPGVITQHIVNENQGQGIFKKMQRYFSKLHLTELNVRRVALQSNDARTFNAFVAAHCSFDRLVIRVTSGILIAARARQLMARAKKEVIIELDCLFMNPDLIRSIEGQTSPPMPRHYKGMRWGIMVKASESRSNTFSPADEQYFLELIRQGHSMERLTAPITSVKNIIETVISSERPVKVDVAFGHEGTLGLFQFYMTSVKATVVQGHSPPEDGWLDDLHPQQREEIRTYQHRGATIHLSLERDGTPHRARVVVASKHYNDA